MLFFQFVAFLIIGIIGSLFYSSTFNRMAQRGIEIGLASYMLGVVAVYEVFMIEAGSFDPTFDIPLHLCTIMLVLSSFALLFKWEGVLRMLAVPIVCGPLLSLVHPYVLPGGPVLVREVYHFAYHTPLVLVGLYVVWVIRAQITWRDLVHSLLFVFGLGMFSIWYNQWTGGNYMFTVTPIVPTKFFVKHIVLYRTIFMTFMVLLMSAYYVLVAKIVQNIPLLRVVQSNTTKKRLHG